MSMVSVLLNLFLIGAIGSLKDAPLSLSWGTYYGGYTDDESPNDAVVDSSGNLYIVGRTYSTDFPVLDQGTGYFQGTKNASSDGFIVKFDSLGRRVWATYIGGDGSDVITGAAIGPDNTLIITGYTSSEDWPVQAFSGAYNESTNTGFYNAFITVFDSLGNIIWSTYYGGGSYDYAEGVGVSSSGSIIITGRTNSSSFPIYSAFQDTLAGGYDAFIVKFNSSYQRVYASYFGGGGDEYTQDVAVDENGNAFIVGYTGSTDMPIQNPGGTAYFQDTLAGGTYDGFTVKFTSSGSVVWATYYGGSGSDAIYAVKTDRNGHVFIAGRTNSADIYLYNPGSGAYYQSTLSSSYSDVVIGSFSTGGTPRWITYFGGNETDRPYDLAIDPEGAIYITGYTGSSDFEVVSYGSGSYVQQDTSYDDVFVSRFNSTFALEWSTYVGGNSNESGKSIAISQKGTVYLISSTSSSDFPLFNPRDSAYFNSIGGNNQTDIAISMFSSPIDMTPPPSPVLIAPLDSAIVGANFEFVWHSVVDDISGVRLYTLQYSMDSTFQSGYTEITSSDTIIPYGLSVDTIYYWRVRAEDHAGNIGDWSSIWTIVNDITPPVLANLTILYDTSYAGPFQITVDTHDEKAGVQEVVLEYKRSEDYFWHTSTMSILAGERFIDTIPAVQFQNDTVQYYIYAEDSVGNTVYSDTIEFIAASTLMKEGKKRGVVLNVIRGNGKAEFNLVLPFRCHVKLDVYNIAGEREVTLINGVYSKGRIVEVFKPKRSGVYMYRLLINGNRKIVRKLIMF